MKRRNAYSDEYVRLYGIIPTAPDRCCVPGLSRTDLYVMAALQGFCANPDYSRVEVGLVANIAINQANAVIRALDRLSMGELLDDDTPIDDTADRPS
jgi:hypothetical protein